MKNNRELRALVRQLRDIDSCTVSDAMDAVGIDGTVRGLDRLVTSNRIFGPVVTVELGPPEGRTRRRHLGVSALEELSPGDVIVVANAGRTESGAWGGLLSLAAKQKRGAGVVVDGLIRDVDESTDIGLPIFARGTTPRTARGRTVELSTNRSVRIGRIAVEPGDVVVADGSGCVFVPADKFRAVAGLAAEIDRREADFAKRMRNGEPPEDVLDSRYEQMLERLS